MGRRRGAGWGLADWADRGTKPGRQERNEVLDVFRNVRGVAPPLREGLDPVRAGGGVVDRAEHEMKPPEHFIARDLGQHSQSASINSRLEESKFSVTSWSSSLEFSAARTARNRLKDTPPACVCAMESAGKTKASITFSSCGGWHSALAVLSSWKRGIERVAVASVDLEQQALFAAEIVTE